MLPRLLLRRLRLVAVVFALFGPRGGEGAFARATAAVAAAPDAKPIDRAALVARHAVELRALDASSPLSVGNGRFAFTADITGLQTFPAAYHPGGCPLETQARWAWATSPNPHGYTLADASRDFTLPDGRVLPFPTRQTSPAGEWLRANPHSHPLARVGLVLREAGQGRDDGSVVGEAITPAALVDLHQRLDLWTGVLTSRYTLAGAPVTVTTLVHPDEDRLVVRLVSPLVAAGRLGVRVAFPRGHDMTVKNNPGLDWAAEGHTTTETTRSATHLGLARGVDDLRYHATLAWSPGAALTGDGPHAWTLLPAPASARASAASAATGAADLAPVAADTLDFSVAYAPATATAGPSAVAPAPAFSFDAVRTAAAKFWAAYWQSGGAVDFAGSTDPRAAELERRVVLSQYLMAVNFGGDFPPQETGLTSNSWYGKHHTEMIWWHTAHFALWGRGAWLERALDWYVAALPQARALAASRGLRGARWPKMIGPDARESPGGNPLIVWNQPHPIHLAELLYRGAADAAARRATLARWSELVFATADGLASMLHWDKARGCYVLGPPLWIAQEIYDQATSQNPSFELSYWATTLELAQQWRERLGQPRDEKWEHARTHLAPLPQKDGRYVAIESTPDTWDNIDSRHDHPTMIAMFGLLPGDGADRATVRRTLDAVLAHWDWETKIWGWDYPMIAMTAARLGDPRAAVDILLRSDAPNNRYVASGHCPQRQDLPVYLPANGSLLAAVAMMAGGWDGAPAATPAPGFPRDGTWTVRAEGLHPLP